VKKLEWIKKCKVCEKTIEAGQLMDHAECKEYAKIVRYEKVD